MKKQIHIITLVGVVAFLVVACGSRKHSGNCDAYGKRITTTGDHAKK